jgi:hypothetical protein
MALRRSLTLSAIALVAAAGCGGSDDGSGGSSKTPAEAPAPVDLVGTYTTTLKPADLPAGAPAELTSGSKQWKLTIANSGGVDDGPVFAIANGELGALENPSFGVKDDVILLHREECGAGGKPFYENAYRYELSGKTLTLTKVKNGCADKVAETILTSEGWTKQG